jgi:arylsulfatase A-like enzyme
VVLVIADALPPRHVTPETTPVLHGLAQRGGWRPSGASAVLASSTYPNHATFATGAGPAEHGVFANDVRTADGVVPARTVGPAVQTIFSVCRERGVGTAAAVGDQHLVGVMGLADADEVWPPAGVLPDGAAVDPLGYALNREVLERAVPLIEDTATPFVLVHLNEPDTYAHGFGPDAPATLAGYRATDAAIGTLVDAARAAWRDTLVLVVSDHEQETVTTSEPIDLRGWIRELGPGWALLNEGSAAVVSAPAPGAPPPLPSVIVGHEALDPSHTLVWGPPGTWFGTSGVDRLPAGVHGSPRSARQVLVVSGGSPVARRVAAQAATRSSVTAQDISATVAAVLDVPLPSGSGVPL